MISYKRSVKRTSLNALTVLAMFVMQSAMAWSAEESQKSRPGTAPPNQAIVGSSLGGSFFAPKPLKEKYDQLVSKVRALEADIVQGRLSSAQAGKEVKQLQSELEQVRSAIERQKTFVSAATIHKKTESTTFELGPERRLLILADQVRIVGWDQPHVKCVLDKTVLTTKNEPVEEQLSAIQIAHEHREAADLVGKLAETLDAEENEYLASDQGRALDAKARAWRAQLLSEQKAWNAIYTSLQGQPIDIVSVKGLSYQDGNRQITLKVESPNGEGSQSSAWQRHAALTVYVPKCETIGLKGGLSGVDIQGVESAVVIRGDGDRDYHGRFRIKDVNGSLMVEGLPLQSIDSVSGDVSVQMTAYLGNSGTRHVDDTRTHYMFVPEPYVYKNLRGGFRGRFVRADLTLSGSGGPIDVENEYGETKLTIDLPLTLAAHRIVSHGGHIDVVLKLDALGTLPVMALTECGTVRLGFNDRTFDDVNWTTSIGVPPTRRGWQGFVRNEPNRDRTSAFESIDRIQQVLDGASRSPGLDLISRGGSIQIVRSGEPQ